MRKFFVLLFVVAIIATLVSSCQTKTVDTKTVVKTTVSEIGSNGFILKKVIKGETIWGYSQETYAKGISWQEIVAENPFLNQPGRVYYDKERAKWIVIIYPGEVVKIRGQVVTPTFTSEEVTTITTESTSGIPWWGWLLIAIGGMIFIFFLVGTVGLTTFNRCYRPLNCCPAPCPCPPVPDPAMPSVTYTSTAGGDRRAYVEGARETTIVHSANGEVTITAHQ